MICPNCKCEYIKGVTQCADCGVPLVDQLEAAPDPRNASPVVSVWEGGDPGERAAVTEALKEAGIPVVDQESAGHLFFPSMNPKSGIFVFAENLERAKKVLADLEAWEEPEELSEGEPESAELPESDGPDKDDDDDDVQADLSKEWHEDDAVAEVWKGSEEDLADTLSMCLREIGIGSLKLSEAGIWRLVVRPEKEAKAKEVVREVVDASPPN
jgi:hypothetical protein